jgi:SsrA-binding protein
LSRYARAAAGSELYNSFIQVGDCPNLEDPAAMAKKDAKAAKSPKTSKAESDGFHVVARNRKARHDYELIEKIEAGIVLTGTEVKSLRNGKANLEDAYGEVDKGEVWLLGCDIPEYLQANRMNHKPKRPRKLLLHRREIIKIAARTGEKGLTLVPLQIHFRGGMAKVELAIARGRKSYDKRQAIKTQEAKRDIQRYQRRGSR